MARQATLRPEMDWSMDAELPQRYKVWKRQVTSELRLQMAEDTNKQQLWACTFIIVCAGEQGENVIQQAKLLEEKEDYTKILDVLDEFVSPSTYFVEDSVNYFYLKQGEMSVSHYQAAAEQLIERMIPHLTPCSSNDNKLLTLLHVARANGIKFNSKKLYDGKDHINNILYFPENMLSVRR